MTDEHRAALYLRSSKDRNDVSIDAQRRALHDLAVAHKLVVVDEFADAVESGKDEMRPGFIALRQAVKNPKRGWSHLCVLDTSRVARKQLIAMAFEHDCERFAVKVLYKNLPDFDPVYSTFMRSIMQAIDELHSMTSKAKGMAGMAENVHQGWRAAVRRAAIRWSTCPPARSATVCRCSRAAWCRTRTPSWSPPTCAAARPASRAWRWCGSSASPGRSTGSTAWSGWR